jgi:chemotaxis methyl-accepting protein methylase
MLSDAIVWQRLRHGVTLLVGERRNSHFTGFLRLPTQFQVLAGPVVQRLAACGRTAEPLRIAVLGCSNGAEAYTIASVLRRLHPKLAFRVRGFDIDGACIEKARSATYCPNEIFNNTIIPAEFVEATFERRGEDYVVRPEIAGCAEFHPGDVLRRDLATRVGSSDIVFAQNFVFHLKRPAARVALDNIHSVVAPGGFLFVDGADLDLRTSFAHRHRLQPVVDEIEQIHNEARRARAVGWPHQYWGLEPFEGSRDDWWMRYATVFGRP